MIEEKKFFVVTQSQISANQGCYPPCFLLASRIETLARARKVCVGGQMRDGRGRRGGGVSASVCGGVAVRRKF